MSDSTDDIDTRIRVLGTVRASAGALDATRALAVMFEDADVRAGVEVDRRRRFTGLLRRHRLLVGAIVALVGVGAAVPAVATSILARTGTFGDPSTNTEVDDTEWIDPGADGASQVVIESYPDYLTLPPGMPENAAIADTARLMGGMGAGGPGQAVVQEGYIVQVYETFGICAWTDVWLTAHAASDTETEALATAWINDFENYRAVSSSDSIRDRMTVIAKAARDGNPGIVKGSYNELDCAVRLSETK